MPNKDKAPAASSVNASSTLKQQQSQNSQPQASSSSASSNNPPPSSSSRRPRSRRGSQESSSKHSTTGGKPNNNTQGRQKASSMSTSTSIDKSNNASVDHPPTRPPPPSSSSTSSRSRSRATSLADNATASQGQASSSAASSSLTVPSLSSAANSSPSNQPLSIAQEQQPHTSPFGNHSTPAVPYPSRAASLPGTSHHTPNPGNSRHRGSQTPNYTAAQYAANNLSAAATAALLGLPNGNLHQNQQNQPQQPQPLMRGSPQLQAQLAHRMTNGTVMGASPTSFGNPAQTAVPNMAAAPAAPPQLQQHSPSAMPYERYAAELTNCIIAKLSPQLPTEEEYRVKEATRRQLERLAGKVIPGARLLAFGSMANGFALNHSDMDLCCLIAETAAEAANGPPASELVEKMAQILREESDFTVIALPTARIPIIKITRPESPERPYGLSCDIGFENRLALENTRLLLTYAMVDPPRLRTLVLFLKVWTKRRKLNSPWMGTLSSYGYTLLVLFFLCHVKRPNVLPNLQRIPPSRPLSQEDIEVNGHNTYFYDDINALKREWQTQNTENVAELVIDFFRYFAKEFSYSRDVISIKTEGGLIPKDGVVWSGELCIEDPFQSGYNVSRTVTKDGLYTIRGEFMRATRILGNRHQHPKASLEELCADREDIVARAPDTPPPRHRYGSMAMHTQHLASDGHRPMYEGSRRGSNMNASGLGGSFAFEEMARGLGRQRGQMAYPTAAMLAPLSQNNLSPRPRNTGLRGGREMSTPGRGGGGGGGVTRSSATVPSSARSDDGNGSSAYDAGRGVGAGVNAGAVTHASARTSPTFTPAVPHDLPTTNDVGEPWAFGSEISFGSERFRLHPSKEHSRTGPSSPGSGTNAVVGAASASSSSKQPMHDRQHHRASRSFSDGINRSKSVARIADEDGAANGLHVAMASLRTAEGASSGGRLSPTASSDVPSQCGTESMAPMQEYTAAWAQKQLQHQDDGVGVGVGGDGHHVNGFDAVDDLEQQQQHERDGVVDDDDDDVSEGVLDELSRISAIEAEGRGRHSRNSSYAEAKLGFGEGSYR